MATGKQIKHYRLKLGWTLEQLEDLSGVATGSIHALEKRDSERSKFFQAIAQAFGMTVEQLSDVNQDYPVVQGRINTTPTTQSPNEAQKQPQVLMQSAPSAIKNIANEATDDNSDLVAALRAFGLRLEHADDTTRRRVKAVLNDLVDDPASHESLLPMLNAALTTPAPSKRRAA